MSVRPRMASGSGGAATASSAGTSTRMPGPIVLAIVRPPGTGPWRRPACARLIASIRARQVLDDRLLLEAALADGDVDDGALVDLELDPTGLDLADRRSRSNVIVPAFGFGIRPRRPRILPSLPTMPIVSGVGEGDVELEPARLDLLHEVLGADLVGSRAERLLGLLALGEHRDADHLAGAVRKDDRAANHLVGVPRIDAEAQVSLDRRVELDGRRLLDERRGLGGW